MVADGGGLLLERALLSLILSKFSRRCDERPHAITNQPRDQETDRVAYINSGQDSNSTEFTQEDFEMPDLILNLGHLGPHVFSTHNCRGLLERSRAGTSCVPGCVDDPTRHLSKPVPIHLYHDGHGHDDREDVDDDYMGSHGSKYRSSLRPQPLPPVQGMKGVVVMRSAWPPSRSPTNHFTLRLHAPIQQRET